MDEKRCLQRSDVSLLDPLELKSEAVVSHHTLVVCTKLRSSERVVYTFNC